MKALKIKDIMMPNPWIISPAQTVKDAARLMKEIDCGVLPVGSADKVIGMITDRDITLRVTAEGKNPELTSVQDIMTRHVYSCDEEADIEEAAMQMRKHKVVRLVVTKGKKATGIVTMSELLREGSHLLYGLMKSPPARPVKMGNAAAGCEVCED